MKHHPTTDETEAGIVLTVWTALFSAGLAIGSAVGLLLSLFSTVLLAVIFIEDAKLERKDKHLKTSRDRLRKESNRE